MEKVTIIIPVYNAQKYIERCVESFMLQSYANKEIILVDDGSTDKSGKICDQMQEKYQRLSVIHQGNKGVSAARNAGIEQATGKYLFFADVDDYAEPSMLEKMIEIQSKKACDLVIAGYYFDVSVVDRSGKQTIKKIANKFSSTYYDSPKEYTIDLLKLWDGSMMYNVWNKLFLRSIVVKNNIKFPEGKNFNEDRDFVRAYLKHTNSIFVTEKCFYYYVRENNKSATDQYRPELFEIRKEEYKVLKDFFEEFGLKDENVQEYLARQHMERVMGCVENIFHDEKITAKYVKSRIKEILEDDLTKETIKWMKPKSGKIKVLMIPYQCNSVRLVYISSFFIYWVRKKCPFFFSKMKQRR